MGTSPSSTLRPPLPFFCLTPPRQSDAISLIGLLDHSPPQRPRHVTVCIDSFGCLSCVLQGDEAEGGDGVQHVFAIKTIQIPRILKAQWLKLLGISIITTYYNVESGPFCLKFTACMDERLIKLIH